VISLEDNLIKTVFAIPKMDCLAEESLVRRALEQAEGVSWLDFDLSARQLTVLHNTAPEKLLDYLVPLGLDVRLIETGPANGEATPIPASTERSTLKLLLAINGAMFLVEIIIGWLAESTGLIADSLDMLADAAVYGVSLYAIGRGATVQAKAARLSGYLQLLLAVGALFEVVRRFFMGSNPEPPFMIGIALLALIANVACLILIAKHRQGGVHMRASWIFSTNDVIANVGVIVAGLLVLWTQSPLPDLVVGAIIAGIVLTGALRILKLARLPTVDATKDGDS
jgi:Co/Zn/Cd efflux system component